MSWGTFIPKDAENLHTFVEVGLDGSAALVFRGDEVCSCTVLERYPPSPTSGDAVLLEDGDEIDLYIRVTPGAPLSWRRFVIFARTKGVTRRKDGDMEIWTADGWRAAVHNGHFWKPEHIESPGK